MEQVLTHKTKLVVVSAPANYAGVVATIKWISLKTGERVRFVIYTGAWAAGTAAVTLKQAVNVAGSSSAALAFAEYYTGTGDTLTKATATSNTFNLAVANSKYVIEVKAADLTSPKDCVSIAIASPGANADYYSVVAEVYGLRYENGAPPTTITD